MVDGSNNRTLGLEEFDAAMNGTADENLKNQVLRALNDPTSYLGKRFHDSRESVIRVIMSAYLEPDPDETIQFQLSQYFSWNRFFGAVITIAIGFFLNSFVYSGKWKELLVGQEKLAEAKIELKSKDKAIENNEKKFENFDQVFRRSKQERDSAVGGRNNTEGLDWLEEEVSATDELVDVVIQNDGYPILLYWNEKETLVKSGETKLQLSAGKAVSVSMTGVLKRSWLQPFRVLKLADGKFTKDYGSVLGRTVITIEENESLRIVLNTPSPPWNAIQFHIDGQPLILTVEAPDPDYSPNTLRPGQVLPNTVMYWAKLGTEGMAKVVAERFIKDRGTLNGELIRVRTTVLLSLIVPVSKEGIPDRLATISEKELTERLIVELKNMLKRKAMSGVTMKQLVEKGRKNLETWKPNQ